MQVLDKSTAVRKDIPNRMPVSLLVVLLMKGSTINSFTQVRILPCPVKASPSGLVKNFTKKLV